LLCAQPFKVLESTSTTYSENLVIKTINDPKMTTEIVVKQEELDIYLIDPKSGTSHIVGTKSVLIRQAL
jgi:hypothetical protein